MDKWYVMQSKPNREFFLLSQLRLNEVEVYLPLVRTINSNGRTRKKPFFPGYLFINVDLSERGTSCLQWIPGSKGMVIFDNQPPSVPDKFIAELRQRLSVINVQKESKFTHLSKGQSVSIIKGPFVGYQALFNKYLSEKDRVKLLLNTLADNAFYIEVPASDIVV